MSQKGKLYPGASRRSASQRKQNAHVWWDRPELSNNCQCCPMVIFLFLITRSRPWTWFMTVGTRDIRLSSHDGTFMTSLWRNKHSGRLAPYSVIDMHQLCHRAVCQCAVYVRCTNFGKAVMWLANLSDCDVRGSFNDRDSTACSILVNWRGMISNMIENIEHREPKLSSVPFTLFTQTVVWRDWTVTHK